MVREFPIDPEHAEMMTLGSQELRQALRDVARGIPPRTRRSCVGLPPAGRERGKSSYVKRRDQLDMGALLALEPLDRVAELMAEGFGTLDIACILGYSTPESANGQIQRVRQQMGAQAV